LAAILVHVTVIRATTGTPRPFNDFYPLANVLYVHTCEISPVYVCVFVQGCVAVWVYPPHTRGTVIISSLGEINRVQPLPNTHVAVSVGLESAHFGVEAPSGFLSFIRRKWSSTATRDMMNYALEKCTMI